MKTVVVMPYRAHPNRDHLRDFTLQWIRDHYDYPVIEADSDTTEFAAGAARNKALRSTGWDVALIHDADTIAHPDGVAKAISYAARADQMIVTADAHMYCDPASTARILASGVPMFPRPLRFDYHGIYERPSGGIVAISRSTFERTGGYVETLQSWGFEDLVFLQCCNLFADGHGWAAGHINLHLYHPPAPRNADTKRNEQVWRTLADYRITNDRAGAREYLAGLGHTVP